MIELSPIELAIFGVGCFIVGNVILFAMIWTWNRILDYMDGNTPMVRHDIKSKLESALGKKE